MPLPPLRDQFNFTVKFALREVLKVIHIRRQVTDQQIDVMARKIVDLQSNSRIRHGPPSAGGRARRLASNEELSA